MPAEINDRFCVIGAPEEHITKLQDLEARGVDAFTIYFIHDNVEGTMEAYDETVIPRFK